MTDAERIAALKAERDRALARAYELSVAYLQTLDAAACRSVDRCPRDPRAPALRADRCRRGRRVGGRRHGGGARPGDRGIHRPALLRLRDRRGAAGSHCRRRADHRLEPERRAACPLAGGGRGRGDRRRVDARPAGPAGRRQRGTADRSRAGQRGRHGRCSPPAAAAGRLGRGGGRAVWRAGDRGDDRRRGARHRADRAAVPGLRPRAGHAHRGRRAGPDADRRAAERRGGARPTSRRCW